MSGQITHRWDGTTLIVTSDSGTSSCDLKGDQGNMGIRGPQGKPGMLTDPSGAIFANPDDYYTKAEMDDTIAALDNSLSPRITNLANTVAIHNKRITNLEYRLEDAVFRTDNSIAYVKDVPANAAPYAEVTKIGGMTRKCTNLIPFPYKDTTLTTNGITFTDNGDGTITANGTATNVAFFIISIQMALPSGTYFISDGCSSLGETAYVRCGNGIFRRSFTTDGSVVDIEIRVASGVTLNNVVFKPMLNIGSTALPYEPYFEGLRSAPVSELVSEGANLIPFPYKDSSQTVRGISYTVNDDGSITANGTATGYASLSLCENIEFKAGETYCLHGGKSNVSIQISYYDVNEPDKYRYLNDTTFTWKSDWRLQLIYVQVVPDVTINNVTVYPMLNKGSTALPYRPYFKRTLPIPETVQALDGYGWGVNDTCYNYIDYEKKQFVKRVGQIHMIDMQWYESDGYWYSYDIQSKALINWCAPDILADNYHTSGWSERTNGNITMNGEGALVIMTDELNIYEGTIYYALAEPEVTDISDILTDDNFIEVEGGGSITAENYYSDPAPTEITYQQLGGAQ